MKEGGIDLVDDLKTFETPEYKGNWKAYKVVATGRWIALILGPLWLMNIDDLIIEMVAKIGIDLWTIERVAKWIVEGLSLPFTIEEIARPIQIISTGLFIVFMVWAPRLKKKVRSAARDLIAQRETMMYGDEIY